MNKIVIIGPAHPLRGGIANFNHRLAKEFQNSGDDCMIYSFSLQYPSIFFPGTSQYSKEPAPEGIRIFSAINSINPLNWLSVGRRLRKIKPDIIIVRFWLPFMGPALGTILRQVRKNKFTRIICLADNIIPHEKRIGDSALIRYFIKSCHAVVTMSDKVMKDLRQVDQNKPAVMAPHPLFDNFGEKVTKQEARQKLNIDKDARVILFFGFIRRYKGLDILFEAMSDQRIKDAGIKLLVAGEFYGDEKSYQEQVAQLGIEKQLILHTEFIPNEEVRYYVCASDAIVQPYRSATQSGVTPLAYHFDKPMIVTDVGGLPAFVPHEKAGLVTKPEAGAIADAIIRFYQLGEDFFIPHLRIEKTKYSWSHFAATIKMLATGINPHP